jgi:O-antigen ligase
MANNAMKKFVTLCLFLIGGIALVVPSGYSFGFYALCFFSLGCWLAMRSTLLHCDARYFFVPLMAFAVGHCALALHERWAAREFETYLPFVLVVFGVWGIRKYKPNANWFWIGLAIGAIGAAVFSGYQSIVLGWRAGGLTHPIQFGNIALLMGVLCLVRIMVVFEWSRLNALLWFGFVSGLAASIWSQTRGGWLAVLLIFIWILAKATQRWAPIKRVVVAFAFFLFLAVPTFQPDGVVQSRIAVAVTEFDAYFKTGQQDTSVGARLAMWKLGVQGLAKAPWFGQGNKGWLQTRDAAIADGRLSQFSGGFKHLHNEYLNVAYKRGMVGLALYLAMLLVPMLLFFKPYLHDGRPDVRSLAMAGMVIPMMFMDFGLTQTFLSHNSGRIVLCSLWMCVAGLMLNAAHNQPCNSKE